MAGGQGAGTGGRGWRLVRSRQGPRQRFQRDENGRAAIESERRMQEALRLKLTGLNNAEVGRQLGVSREGARKILLRAMDRLREDNAADANRLRSLEVARIDKALTYIFPRLQKGDLGAVREFRGLVELRCRLLALFPQPDEAPKADPREFAAKVQGFLAATEGL